MAGPGVHTFDALNPVGAATAPVVSVAEGLPVVAVNPADTVGSVKDAATVVRTAAASTAHRGDP